MVKKFRPKINANKVFMDCDICHDSDFRFIINLKPEGFSEKGANWEKEARRVCQNCALYFFKKGIYNFSFRWRELFLERLTRLGSKESNKEKYLVIHE